MGRRSNRHARGRLQHLVPYEIDPQADLDTRFEPNRGAPLEGLADTIGGYLARLPLRGGTPLGPPSLEPTMVIALCG